ncbi:MAG: RhuM family protein [Chitinophagaceae bacterium]
MNEIIIYQTSDNQTQIDVKFENETVWLTQKQMAELFDSNRVAITQHIGNIFKEGELDEKVVCKDFLHTTQYGVIQGKAQEKSVKYKNLDVIISVGYRVKSKQGTQFRIWATQKFKEILVKGYSINQKRLDELKQTVQLIQKTVGEETNLTEAKGLLDIISQYAESFVLLNQFDGNSIEVQSVDENITYETSYAEVKIVIAEFKKQMIKKKDMQLINNR